MKVLLHVDMDAFFASAELTRHPEWRGRPLIVGSGPHERGVVSTCSYEARRFGVHSAMASQVAYRLCPEAVFTPPDMSFYSEISHKVFDIFEQFTPYVEGVSIDEAFLDITGSLHLHGDDSMDELTRARLLGEKLQLAVHQTCGITCSVGIAPNRLLAKIGSELNKPNGLSILPFKPDEIAKFLLPKPIGILWGVGRTTQALLAKYGLTRCGDIQRLPFPQLESILGFAAARSLTEFAFGRSDDCVYWEDATEKSVSREHTFEEDATLLSTVRAKLLDLVREVGHRFRTEKRWAGTARIKVRTADFRTFTRQKAFELPARDDTTFREAALTLLKSALPPDEILPQPIRLIGFGVTNLRSTPQADGPSLFTSPADEKRERREKLSAALDALRDKGLNV